MIRRPPRSTLFPYTTLFRSHRPGEAAIVTLRCTLDSLLLHAEILAEEGALVAYDGDRKSTRLNSSHSQISYAVFCLKKKKRLENIMTLVLTPTRAMQNDLLD